MVRPLILTALIGFGAASLREPLTRATGNWRGHCVRHSVPARHNRRLLGLVSAAGGVCGARGGY